MHNGGIETIHILGMFLEQVYFSCVDPIDVVQVYVLNSWILRCLTVSDLGSLKRRRCILLDLLESMKGVRNIQAARGRWIGLVDVILSREMVLLVFAYPLIREQARHICAVSLVESRARLLHVVQDHGRVWLLGDRLWLLVSIFGQRSVHMTYPLTQNMHRLLTASLCLNLVGGEAHLLTLGPLLLPRVEFVPIGAQSS